MTDLEMTRLCAEAAGILLIGSLEGANGIKLFNGKLYDPLHDDAQAMALIKRFHIELWYDTRWAGQIRNLLNTQAIDADLNRAIVQVVAQAQQAKEAK